jgi:16S rRNA (adenine1518-N6/adenine1519-N6)-dimethyltransferase
MSQHPRTKKSLGQHFLKDGNMIRKIVDAIPAGEGDTVIEIGPGAGALTGHLMERFSDFSVIEIDNRMVEFLNDKFSGLTILHENVLDVNWKKIIRGKTDVHVIGNLPYYITSQILFSLLEHRTLLKSALLMMQKEVAERIVANPNSKQYGILSVQSQLMATPTILFDVPPQVFSPPPKVNSSVIRLLFDKPPLLCKDENLKTIVRMAFNQRRKKLSNALKRLNAELPEDIFNFNLRAEAISPDGYEKMTAHFEQLGTFG